MEREQTTIRQLTVRMTEGMFQETKEEADQIGSSHNSFIMMMIKLGLKTYNADVIIQKEVR